MPIYLTTEFIRDAQREPFIVMFGDREITIEATEARQRRPNGMLAELQVVESGVIVGYLTPYGETEHGAIRASLFSVGVPQIFRTLDDALREILI
jgi:hypothetical protein